MDGWAPGHGGYRDVPVPLPTLPGSSLLTLHGWGHTSLFLSRCVDRISAAYLISQTTPEPGTICHTDEVPFRQTAARSAATGPREQVIPSLVPYPLGPLRGT